MKTLKILLFSIGLTAALASCSDKYLSSLGRTMENSAKNAVERKAQQKTDEVVSGAIDAATNPDTYRTTY
jgi:hypothetical protein